MNYDSYSYFDEDYFQRGELKGTVYRNYLEASKSSPVYREIAQAIIEVFRPRRVLEVGCATGIVVKYLNDNGVEAYGIDVSSWAVKNAEHRNVILCPADCLPFADKYFDLVFSCHSLEHIPDPALDSSIKEMTRVCSCFQFHTLPMVGVKPYVGETKAVINGLRKDPTHYQLHDYEWWVSKFMEYGNEELKTFIAFKYDNETYELTNGQIILKKKGVVDCSTVLKRIIDWNRNSYEQRAGYVGSISFKGFSLSARKILHFTKRSWQDLDLRFEQGYDIKDKQINVLIIAEGGPCTLRLAFCRENGSDKFGNVREQIFNVRPGVNWYRFEGSAFNLLRGNRDLTQFNRMLLGGECSENTRLEVFVFDNFGKSLL